MFLRLVSIFLCLNVVCTVPAYAQKRGSQNAEVSARGPRKHLSTIVFAGLAGAILGLSTLSFYGRPQDKLANVPVGFAIGVIGGAMFSTYKVATEPRDLYGKTDPREAWPENLTDLRFAQETQTPRLRFQFEF